MTTANISLFGFYYPEIMCLALGTNGICEQNFRIQTFKQRMKEYERIIKLSVIFPV